MKYGISAVFKTKSLGNCLKTVLKKPYLIFVKKSFLGFFSFQNLVFSVQICWKYLSRPLSLFCVFIQLKNSKKSLKKV
jgi:hypothetical protein